LLLASSEVDQKDFSEIVQMLERTFFRYTLICNEILTILKSIYSKEALNIRNNSQLYSIETLRTQLSKLFQSKAGEQTFRNLLTLLQYKGTGTSNKPPEYFLLSVEYYYQWYKNGANGKPVCHEKSRVYDFAGSSIEHVYPPSESR
jgi:hypothetical protein